MPGIWYELERIFKEDNVQIGLFSYIPSNFDINHFAYR